MGWPALCQFRRSSSSGDLLLMWFDSNLMSPFAGGWQAKVGWKRQSKSCTLWAVPRRTGMTSVGCMQLLRQLLLALKL